MFDFAQLHFIRPYFLIGIILLPILSLLLIKMRGQQTAWRNLLPAHLQQHQIEEGGQSSSSITYWLLALIWMLSSVGLAGPSWEKLPQPVYQTQEGKVLILDMSMSMRATDISPDRLTRAKFKSLDLLNSIQEGEIGLIAYAGDAFIISPLTDDIANLQNLIPSLSPEIMPVQGSNPLVAFDKAKELLTNAGYQEGEIYWITDGIEYRDIELLQEELANSTYKVSSLLVGTTNGAPIKMADGSLLKDATGKIVIPRASEGYIQQALGAIGGKVTRMTTTASDIEKMVIDSIPITKNPKETEELSTGDVWEDMGVYITIGLLPLVAYFFRRGVFVCVFVGLTFLPKDTVYAQEVQDETQVSANDVNTNVEASELSLLNKLFLNPDQRGEIAYAQEDYASAQETFNDPSWKAASAYKSGNYERALELYTSMESETLGAEQHTTNQYNKANSLAKLTRLEEALEAYEELLKNAPKHKEAQKNKAIVEAMLQQQEQQQQNQDSNENSDNQQQDEDQKQQDQQGEQSQQDDQQSDQQSQEDQQNQSQEQQNQQGDAESDSKPDEDKSDSNDQSQDDQQEQGKSPNSGNAEQSDMETQANPQELREENPESVIEGQINPEDLSPEEREQLQKMQMLMNKVPDDPAFLLKRKMLLESQTRRQNRAPVLQQQTW